MCVCVCVCVILLSHKKHEVLPLVTTWMDLEGVILREILVSLTEKDIPYYFTYTWNPKNTITEQTSFTETEQTDGCRMEGGLWSWVKKMKGLRSRHWQL